MSTCWGLGVWILVAAACAGCGEQTTTPNGGAGKGQAGDAEGGQSGRSSTAVAKDGGSGNAALPPSGLGSLGTTRGAPRDGGPISQAEWDRISGLQHVDTDIERERCPREPVGQEYLVRPRVSCKVAVNYSVTNRIRFCDVDPYCTRHAECTDRPSGRCLGLFYADCEYDDVDNRAICTTDADCTSLPNGICSQPIMSDTTCYPTGECRGPQSHCIYPPTSCAIDADCQAASGGRCNKYVQTRCYYDKCRGDSDCTQGERCGCSPSAAQQICAPADCSVDSDCPQGMSCRSEYGCFDELVAYHCATPQDQCATQDDCDGAPCAYRDNQWTCRTEPCPFTR